MILLVVRVWHLVIVIKSNAVIRYFTIFFSFFLTMSGGTKIFVYGINRSCPKDILEDKFAKHGTVSDVYITEKGYAFVTMNDENEARAAIDELNGSNIDGQEVIITFPNLASYCQF